MGLIPSSRYPAQTDIAGAYPQGKARNATTQGDGTGTPLEKDWVNDIWGFLQALLANASIVPSGSPDQVGASDYLAGVQFIANTASAAAALAAVRASTKAAHLTSFASVSLEAASPATSNLAAVYDSASGRTLLCEGGANGTSVTRDDLYGDHAGDTGTVTGVIDAAMDPATSTVVVVGNGGAFAARSTNFGTSWTDATGAVARDCVKWDAVNGLFLASKNLQATVYTSPTGAAWTSRALSGTATQSNGCGLAVSSTGIAIVARGSSTTIAFDRSTNGTTWASSGTTLPNIATDALAGGFAAAVCSLGATLYAAAHYSVAGVKTLRVFSSLDGVTWTLVGSIPTTNVGSGALGLFADPYSGALYAQYNDGNSKLIYLSTDGGVTWVGPGRVFAGLTAIKPAGGRIWTNVFGAYRATTRRLDL